MKTIKIGRDPSCQILLDHEMISRHHAILRIYPTGKMELVSMGANGTKLNGALMRPNVVYKVKRSDMISFADRFQLDWKTIYNPMQKYHIASVFVMGIIVLAGVIKVGMMLYDYFNPFEETEMTVEKIEIGKEPLIPNSNEETVINVDTITADITNVSTSTKSKGKGFSSKDFFVDLKPKKESIRSRSTKKQSDIENTDSLSEPTDSLSEPTDSFNIREKVII